MVPRKFVAKYGECLPKTMSVKTPNGVNWKLNLVKSDGKIWFRKGWKEFEEYHSLAHGHLLLFKYERTSHLHVHIFDKSALEINYPLTRGEAKRVFNCQGKKTSNNEDCRASQKRKANSSFEIGSSSCVNVRKFQKAAVHHVGRKGKGMNASHKLLVLFSSIHVIIFKWHVFGFTVERVKSGFKLKVDFNFFG